MFYQIINFIIILAFLFTFDFCLTNEKSECLYQKRLDLENKTLFTSCKQIIFSVAFAPSSLKRQDIQDLIILTCLLDYSVKYSCRNKSNTKPIIGENDWGRTSEE
ncbi:MAG: hypothetical protein H7A23_20310 [Leptospiraceae bacterium]|nr:hypothetical protein [Leptospiraceae bacterium]